MNGIPVAAGDTGGTILLAQLSPFLISGRNTIELRSVRLAGTRQPLALTVRRRAAGGAPEDVAVLSPPALEEVGEAVVRPVALDVSMPLAWSWEAAADDPVTPTDRTAIIGVLRALHENLLRGDGDAAVERLALLLRETALMRDGVVERVRERYREWMAAPEWSVDAFDATVLSIERYGKLVRVSVPGRPLFESNGISASTARFRIASFYLARLDGRWVIVRRGP